MKSRLVQIVWLILILTVQARADNLGYTKQNPLIIGIDMDYAPMEYVDVDGIPYGLDVDFTKVLMKRLNIPFTYAPNTWENIAGDVIHGRVDLGMMVYSPYRENITNYSRAVFRLYYQIVYRKSDKVPYGLRDVQGKNIALMASRPVQDTLQKAKANPILIKDLSLALKDLSEGKYDAVICFRYQASHIISYGRLSNLAAADLALMPREYCYVSHDKILINAINEELDKMDKEGVIDDIYGDVKANFGSFRIPTWIWAVIAAVVILALLLLIVQQRISKKRLQVEMERARKSEELKDIFLSNLSHALRTPLNAIIGFSDLLMSTPQEDMGEEEKNHLLGLINSNGLQLLHLINELLSLSDIESNTLLFDRQVIDLDTEMASYAQETRMQLKEGVEMIVIEPIGGLRALVDPKLLRMLTMHLLDNARMYTMEGKVTLSYYAKEDGLYVEVKDTGCGLPENLKENIFALLKDKNTYVQENTPGLGLSICKAILDKDNGKIGARDNIEDGRGTIMWFWVPVKILN